MTSFFVCICVKHEGSTAISMSVISASCGGNYAPLIRIFNPFFNVFTSVFHHLRHVFTKMSTDTMLSSVLESVFIFM